MRCSGISLSAAIAIAMFALGSSASVLIAQDQKHEHDQGTEKHAHSDQAVDAEKAIGEALDKLSAEDRKLAMAQRFCPMMVYSRLGSMGTPIKATIDGKPVFVCCEDCVEEAKEHPAETLATVLKLTKVSAELAKLTPEDRAAIEAQKYCVVADGSFLGGMGPPVKLVIDEHPVFLCCKGCTSKANANPKATLEKAAQLINAGKPKPSEHKHDHE